MQQAFLQERTRYHYRYLTTTIIAQTTLVDCEIPFSRREGAEACQPQFVMHTHVSSRPIEISKEIDEASASFDKSESDNQIMTQWRESTAMGR